jgi:hypothetical protein
MRELIRHILHESTKLSNILNVIKDEGIFVAAEMVGGLNNLKRIIKDEPEIKSLIESLKGKLSLVHHSRKEYIEFPFRFEIVGVKKNTWKTNSWPVLNLIYDDSNLSQGEKKLLDQFIYHAIGDLNVADLDINPKVRHMYKDGSYFAIDFVNGKNWESLDNNIEYNDDDIKNLHREYYIKSYMNESKILQENEEDPTQKILNFLRRRYEVKEKKVGDDEDPIIYKTLTIDMGNQDVYGMNTFISKKEQIRLLTSILMNHNVIDSFEFNVTKDNPYAQKVI